MEETKYQEILEYLDKAKTPFWIKTKGELAKFVKETKAYQIQNGILVHLEKKGEPTQVIQRHQVSAILYMLHDDPLGGHAGAGRMNQKLRERYFWEKSWHDCKNYVRTCHECQMRGGPQKNNVLHPIPVGDPWDRIGIDVVGPLPITERGNRYIVAAIDYMTKYVEARPIAEKSAMNIAWFIYEDIICRHGCPKVIQSDNGTEFVNEVITELTKQFNVYHQRVSPYRPQANGLIERFNRTMCESLSKLGDNVHDWDKFVRPTIFAHNTSESSATKTTPFYLVYGRKATLPIDRLSVKETTLWDRILQLIKQLPLFRASAKQAIRQAQEEMRRQYKIQEPKLFQIGDQVLYDDTPNYHTKLEHKWVGPWTVTEVLYNGTYKVADHIGVRKAPINGDHLKMYHKRADGEPMVVIGTTANFI